jgi:hypothetical protein
LQEYAKYYVRLSLLGVDNINELTECSKALPLPQVSGSFTANDQGLVDQWLNTTKEDGNSAQVANELRAGQSVINLGNVISNLWQKSKSSKFRGS